MELLDRVCKECIALWGKCSSEDNCCIFELKLLHPDANADFMFFYCCVLKCGFNKHQCDRCFLTKSGIIKFVRVDKLEKPSDPAQLKLFDY